MERHIEHTCGRVLDLRLGWGSWSQVYFWGWVRKWDSKFGGEGSRVKPWQRGAWQVVIKAFKETKKKHFRNESWPKHFTTSTGVLEKKTLPLTGLVKEAFLDEGDVFSDEVSAVACWKDAHSWSAADSVEGWGRFRGMTVVWIMFRNRPIVGSTSSGLITSSSSLNVIRIWKK